MRAIVFLIFSCSVWFGSASWAQVPERRVIAFAQDTLKNDFRKAQVFEVRDEVAKHPGLSFVYADAQGQTSLLIRQILRRRCL